MIRFLKVNQTHSDNLIKYGINHQFAFEQITINLNLSPQERINEVLIDMLKYLAEIGNRTRHEILDVTKTASPINIIDIEKVKNVTPKIISTSFTMKLSTSYLLKAQNTNARQQFNRFSQRHNLHQYGIFPAVTIAKPPIEFEDDLAVHEGIYFNFAQRVEPQKFKFERVRPLQNSLESIKDCDEQIEYFFDNVKDLEDSHLLWLMSNIVDYSSAAAYIKKLRKRDGRLTAFYKIAKDMYPDPLPYSKIVGDDKFRYDFIYEAVNSPLTKTIQIAPEAPSLEHNEIFGKLDNIFRACLDDNKTRIHLIRLDTGTGKTTVAMKYLSKKMAYIAPTHRLLQQSIEDLKKLNPDILDQIVYIPQITDEELPEGEKKQILLESRKQGLSKKVKKLQKEIIKNQGSPKLQKKYVEYLEAMEKKEGVPFLTHARFSMTNMFSKNFQNVEVFLIDEDPTKILFPSVEYADEFVIDELNRFIEFCVKAYKLHPNAVKRGAQRKLEAVEAIRKVINSIKLNETITENRGEYFFKKNADLIQTMATDMSKLKNPQKLDFLSVLAAKIFVKKQNGKANKYYADNSARFRGKKLIVMSATLDKNVHFPMFARLVNPDTHWYDVGRTKNEGKIYCYPEFSTTKAALANTPAYVEKINETINALQIDNVLTYKDMKDKFPKKTAQMHFYNSAGYNDLSGKNLAVVGTPNNQIEEIVAIGYLIFEKLPQSYVGTKLAVKSQAIIRDEFKFSFFTFAHREDEFFRQVHLWSTYSELLQAIGRARAVHHDCDVHVFSRLPIPQGTLKKYSEVV